MTMEGWIQILNNTIAQFGHLLPEEGVENLQRVRDQMEMLETRWKWSSSMANHLATIRNAR